MQGRRPVVAVVVVMIAAAGWAEAQRLPLFPSTKSGRTVTPAYEGWYANPDGTFTLSFGYYNRNSEEVVEIPLGTDNFIEPAELDGWQPTHFQPLRHWGVFTVTVPADFGDRRVTWTLVNNGQTFAIPGHLHREWLIDARYDPANENYPPVLKFDPAGPEGTAPDGVTTGPLTAPVGEPLTLNAWATDDGGEAGSLFAGRRPPLILAWFKHQGPGAGTGYRDVQRGRARVRGGERPGDYDGDFQRAGRLRGAGARQRPVRRLERGALPVLLDERVCEGDGFRVDSQ